jgi:hypothetical protein
MNADTLLRRCARYRAGIVAQSAAPALLARTRWIGGTQRLLRRAARYGVTVAAPPMALWWPAVPRASGTSLHLAVRIDRHLSLAPVIAVHAPGPAAMPPLSPSERAPASTGAEPSVPPVVAAARMAQAIASVAPEEMARVRRFVPPASGLSAPPIVVLRRSEVQDAATAGAARPDLSAHAPAPALSVERPSSPQRATGSAAIDVRELTDRVVQAIDRRLLVAQERMGARDSWR